METLTRDSYKEHEIKHPDEENSWKNKPKRRRLSIKTESDHEGMEKFKCDICYMNFGQKGNLKRHVKIVHEGTKQFNCNI